MSIALLTIGDEVCIGQITNTNASWMADRLRRRGYRVVTQSTIGDSLSVIVAELRRLAATHRAILITGGLGPTHDDLTKDALAEFLGDVLREDAEQRARLEQFLIARGREVTPRQLGQVMLPSTASAIPNEVGTAPGILAIHEGVLIASMPGVPREMKSMMEQTVLEAVERHLVGSPVIVTRTLTTVGVGESNLADAIGDPSLFLPDGAELAFLPFAGGVRLRITVEDTATAPAQHKAELVEEVLRGAVGEAICGSSDETLIESVAGELRRTGLTVSVAESCTGGLLGAALTELPGSSQWFMGGVQSYSNDAKVKFLGVNPESLGREGAVSEPVACEMASGARAAFATDVALSITGIAGPDGGTPNKPVGTIWVGISTESQTRAVLVRGGNDRVMNRERAVTAALELLLDICKKR